MRKWWFILWLVASYAWGQNISIYQEPSTTSNAKPLTTGEVLIPITVSKNGKWLKAFTPEDGYVGWVLLSTLNGYDYIEDMNVKISQTFNIHKTRDTNMIHKLISYEYSPSQSVSHSEVKERIIKRHELSEKRVEKLFKFWKKMDNFMLEEERSLAKASNIIDPKPKTKQAHILELESPLFEAFPHKPLSIIVPKHALTKEKPLQEASTKKHVELLSHLHLISKSKAS